jgi:hypothetical protein
MSRRFLVALTMVAFTLAMTAWGWVVGASVPVAVDWLWERIGATGAWALFLSVMAALAAYIYRNTGKPKGT